MSASARLTLSADLIEEEPCPQNPVPTRDKRQRQLATRCAVGALTSWLLLSCAGKGFQGSEAPPEAVKDVASSASFPIAPASNTLDPPVAEPSAAVSASATGATPEQTVDAAMSASFSVDGGSVSDSGVPSIPENMDGSIVAQPTSDSAIVPTAVSDASEPAPSALVSAELDSAVNPLPSADGATAVPSVCEAGTVQGPHDNCYYFGTEKQTWDDARAFCRTLGEWDLLEINDIEEHEFVSPKLTDQTWLGATDRRVEDEWRWVGRDMPFFIGVGETGSAVGDAFSVWAAREPTAANTEQCLRYVQDSADAWVWADTPCDRTYKFVCEQGSE